MRRLVVAAVVAALAIALAVTLAGCGGDQPSAEEPAIGAEPEAAAPPAPASAVGAGIQPPEDASPTEAQAYEPLPKDPEIVPESVLTRLEAGQPMLVYFYDSEQPTTKDQTAIINEVLADYRGLVDLVRFDIGKYAGTDGEEIQVDERMLEDPEADKAMKFAGELGVSFTPYILIVDEKGYTLFRGSGLVDDSTLEQQILRIGG